jgi:hypothetical protein
VIKATARGGSTFFSNTLKLSIICPSIMTYTTEPFNQNFVSFKGATEADAELNFGETMPDLPFCTQVLDYEFTDVLYTDLSGNPMAITS